MGIQFDTPIVPTEERARDLRFPRRAPVQTWMMLTFALLLGIAMVVVAVYAFPVLKQQVQNTAEEVLREETARVLEAVSQAESEAEVRQIARRASQFSGHRVTVIVENDVLFAFEDGELLPDAGALGAMAAEQVAASGNSGAREVVEQGRRILYVARGLEETGLVVQIGQIEPPLYRMLRPMQVALITSMILALVLALIGSWIAATRITTPLQALNDTATRINAGQLDEEIAVQSRASEFQDLSETLDEMAEQFREDITQLQRLIRIQNEFLGNVSHEVRNPIFAIGGYLEALGDSRMRPERRLRYVQKGLNNLERLNTLFSDLVEIARLEFREDLIHREIFDLQDLVEEVAETARLKAEAKNLTLDVVNPHVYVEADRNRIAQVLTNLIENGIAYTDEGGVQCRLSEHGDHVRVEVRDSGKGIGPEHLDRIFDRFYRVDAARSRKHGGSGLGLSIVKQILHAHGGKVHVESTPGKGSMFWFELPRVTRGDVRTRRVSADAPAPGAQA